MADDDTRIILFRTRLRDGIADAYGARAEAIYALVERMPGFVAAKDFAAEDGERLAVIEFDSPAHLAAWRTHAEHRAAQQQGRSEFYAEYQLQICAVLRESKYRSDSDPLPLPAVASPRSEPIDAEGGCACGHVRYRVRGRPRFATLCHCADCRRASGATPVGWAVFREGEVTWLAAEPRARASSERAVRSFCPECGCQIAFRYHAYPDFIDLTIASLDAPELIAPRDHIWMQSRIAWTNVRDELTRHDRDLDVGQ